MNYCKARQYSDQMLCDRCGLQWDVNDPDKPECLPEKKVRIQELRNLLNKKTRRKQ